MISIEKRTPVNTCYQVKCDKCDKPTWKRSADDVGRSVSRGCGSHIETALKDVKVEDRIDIKYPSPSDVDDLLASPAAALSVCPLALYALVESMAPIVVTTPREMDVVERAQIRQLKEDLAFGRANVLNHYVAGAFLGQGTHGKVFKCWDISRNHELEGVAVAIKKVKRRTSGDVTYALRQNHMTAWMNIPIAERRTLTEQNFHREVAVMKKCRHPNVVNFIEVIDDREKADIMLVMEYQSGGELKWKTSSDEPVISVTQTRRVLRDVILGLEYLHHQGILHRDLKPANFLYSRGRQVVKITDFGVAYFSKSLRSPEVDGSEDALADSDSKELRMSEKGTPAFVPPELYPVENAERVDATPAVDVWALGISLYCLLFGKPPFWVESSSKSGLDNLELKKIIRESDWRVPQTMGSDRLPTGGRKAREGPIPLIDLMLQKDPKKRITLHKLKRHPWVVFDIKYVKQWLERTSPTSLTKVKVDTNEINSAVASVYFRLTSRWRLGRVPSSSPDAPREPNDDGTRSLLAPASRRRPAPPTSASSFTPGRERPQMPFAPTPGKPRRGSESMLLTPCRVFHSNASTSTFKVPPSCLPSRPPQANAVSASGSATLTPALDTEMRACSYSSSLAAATRDDFLPGSPADIDRMTRIVGAGGVQEHGDSPGGLRGMSQRSSFDHGYGVPTPGGSRTNMRRSSSGLHALTMISTASSLRGEDTEEDSEDDDGLIFHGRRPIAR